MSDLVYQIFISTGLTTLGLYNLTTTIHTYLKSPTTFLSKPYHPLNHQHHLLRHLPLLLTSLSLLISSLHHLLHPTLHLSSLLSSSLSLLFLLLSLSPLLPFLPHDLLFASASVSFLLLSSSPSPSPSPSLLSHLVLLSSRISLASSLSSLALALSLRLFIADVALSASLILQGLWMLQMGLSLHVDGFIPEGCYKLLDVVPGVDGSTKCELDESLFRAVAILDLMFVVYVLVVVVIVFSVYGILVKVTGVSVRRFGSYEALPTAVGVDGNHVQLKTLSGTQA